MPHLECISKAQYYQVLTDWQIMPSAEDFRLSQTLLTSPALVYVSEFVLYFYCLQKSECWAIGCAQRWCKYSKRSSLWVIWEFGSAAAAPGTAGVHNLPRPTAPEQGGVALQCWEVLDTGLEKGAIY